MASINQSMTLFEEDEGLNFLRKTDNFTKSHCIPPLDLEAIEPIERKSNNLLIKLDPCLSPTEPIKI